MRKKLGPAYLPALKGQIGTWAYYTTLMTMEEVNSRIRLSEEIYQNKRLSDMVQRSVRSDRAKKIANYLKNEEERFFPAMVVAVFEGAPDWVEFSIKHQSNNADIDLSMLDRAKLDSFGLLALTGEERLFPLDGQHRLAGIREALSDPDTKTSFLPDDEITVMLVAHEPSDTGRTRSRRLFTTLNKRAVSVKKHETIALDEDDVMAIATRHLVERFKPLAGDGVVSFRTNANITAHDTKVFTTIVTLYDTLFDLFKSLSKRSAEDLKYNRPDEAWTEVYLACAESFYETLLDKFPSVGECLLDEEPEKHIKKNRRSDGGHILFRPVGQRMIGQLVAELAKGAFSEKFEDASVSPEAVKGVAIAAIKDAFDALSELPVEISEKPYAGLIFDVETHRMNVSRAALLRDIILKNFGLISGRADRGLETRIQKTIGDGFSAGDFFW